MKFLLDLWLPIVAAALAAWSVSVLIWTVIGHHRWDGSRLASDDQGEDNALDQLRAMNLKPGVYVFPYAASTRQAGTFEYQTRMIKGPMGTLRIWRSQRITLNLLTTLVYFFAVSVTLGYLGSMCVPSGATFLHALRVMGTASVLAYAFAFVPSEVWRQNSWRAIVLSTLDGLAYGLASGAGFALLWPAA